MSAKIEPEAPRERSEAFKALLAYINDTPELLSLLYDLNLMPEQVEIPSGDCNRMILLTRWHQLKSEETQARADRLASRVKELEGVLTAISDAKEARSFYEKWESEQSGVAHYEGICRALYEDWLALKDKADAAIAAALGGGGAGEGK